MSTDNRQLAPFIHTEKNAPYIYITILVSLVPCIFCGVFYYGLRAFILILFCMVSFVLSDNLCMRITGRRSGGDYFDLSSLVEGLLIALMLPPDTTLITALTAVLFASIVTKQVFGGAGSNIINPACAGRLFIELVMPNGTQGLSYGEDNSRLQLMSLIVQKKPGALPDLTNLSGLLCLHFSRRHFPYAQGYDETLFSGLLHPYIARFLSCRNDPADQVFLFRRSLCIFHVIGRCICCGIPVR